jgi:hypothetical protein
MRTYFAFAYDSHINVAEPNIPILRGQKQECPAALNQL